MRRNDSTAIDVSSSLPLYYFVHLIAQEELQRKAAYWFGPNSKRKVFAVAPHDDDDDVADVGLVGNLQARNIIEEEGELDSYRQMDRNLGQDIYKE